MAAKKKDSTDILIPKTKRMTMQEIMKAVRKEHGETSINIYDKTYENSFKRTTSGILALDVILGGGWPDGRIIEIYGPESSGKTTIALHAIKAAQELGKQCAYIDAEHALDVLYARNLGVNMDNLLVSTPMCGEEGLDVTDSLVRTGSIDLIVVDSVAALVPKKELDGDFGDSNVGLHARLMSQAMRKLAGPAEAMKCTIIFINQIREKVGVMFGNPETTTGGRALRFYASVRLDVRKREALKDGDEVYANRTVVKTVKNKTFPPMKKAEFDILFGKGVDNTGSVIDIATDCGIVEKGGGGYYSYDGQRFHGRPSFVTHLSSSEGADMMAKLDKSVREFLSRNDAEEMGLTPEELQQTKQELDAQEAMDDAAEEVTP